MSYTNLLYESGGAVSSYRVFTGRSYIGDVVWIGREREPYCVVANGPKPRLKHLPGWPSPRPVAKLWPLPKVE